MEIGKNFAIAQGWKDSYLKTGIFPNPTERKMPVVQNIDFAHKIDLTSSKDPPNQ